MAPGAFVDPMNLSRLGVLKELPPMMTILIRARSEPCGQTPRPRAGKRVHPGYRIGAWPESREKLNSRNESRSLCGATRDRSLQGRMQIRRSPECPATPARERSYSAQQSEVWCPLGARA